MTGCLDLHGHVGEFDGDGLEVGDRFIELDAGFGILHGIFERRPPDTDSGGADGGPRPVERPHGNEKTGALSADAVPLGHPDILKEKLGRV